MLARPYKLKISSLQSAPNNGSNVAKGEGSIFSTALASGSTVAADAGDMALETAPGGSANTPKDGASTPKSALAIGP